MATSAVKACFLTWLEHRRTRELSARLGMELVELISTRKGWRRYAELVPRTIAWLRQNRPRVVVVQSPSIVLAALTVTLRPWLGFKLVFDAHNEAVEPVVHPSTAIRLLTHWLLPRADRVLVTNRQLADTVAAHGGKPLVLWDPLPHPPHIAPRVLPGNFRVAVISTYAADEPFDAVVLAARQCSADIHFFVTGNPSKVPDALRAQIPANMTLTGFLPEEEYWFMLAACDVIMDLTTMDNCLVCGAYEAIALGRPVVLSDNSASREIFGGFGEFADNTPDGLVRAVARVRDEYSGFASTAPGLRRNLEDKWRAQAAVLTEFIASA